MCPRLSFALAALSLLLASCAHKEPEVDFKPIQLTWNALSDAAENHPEKDGCVIAVTAKVMREKAVLDSRSEVLDYLVNYDLKGEILEFEGFCGNPAGQGTPECRWTATCSGPENVVVKFHNGD